jgi:hypothetical protein
VPVKFAVGRKLYCERSPFMASVLFWSVSIAKDLS